MRRPSPLLRIVLLWLLVALLPLRAWAQADMALADPAPTPLRLTTSATPAAGQVDPLPHPACHAGPVQAHQPDHGASSAEVPHEAGAHSSCPSCDLCHGSMVAGLPRSTPPLLPREAPTLARTAGWPEGDTTRLFRPPRRSAGTLRAA